MSSPTFTRTGRTIYAAPPNSNFIADTDTVDNAKMIEVALNSHDDMIAALCRIVREYRANDLTIGAIEDTEEVLARLDAV